MPTNRDRLSEDKSDIAEAVRAAIQQERARLFFESQAYGSLTGGALASLAACWPAYLAYAGTGLLFYVADLTLNGAYAGKGAVPAAAVLAYLTLMLVVAWGYQRRVLESLRHRFATNDLTVQLPRTRAASETPPAEVPASFEDAATPVADAEKEIERSLAARAPNNRGGPMKTQTILIVDDSPCNLHLLAGILQDRYLVRLATSGPEALMAATAEPAPDLVLLDVNMPGMNGFEVCRRLKSDPCTRAIPVIFVTASGEIEDEREGFDAGAVDYILKPVRAPIVQARVRTQLALADQNRELECKVHARTSELNESRLEIIRRLSRAGEYRDNETGMHVQRMSQYAQTIARELGFPAAESETLLNAAPMHDIGKIGIPDRILIKRGKLEAAEWSIMKRHPQMGASIIGRHASPLLKMARIVALTHHEKWDGGGYPRGLRGEQIPLVGRIVALADVFDALTTERPYKEAWPVEDALDLIRRERERHFDPAVADAFLGVLPEILRIRDLNVATGREAGPRRPRLAHEAAGQAPEESRNQA